MKPLATAHRTAHIVKNPNHLKKTTQQRNRSRTPNPGRPPFTDRPHLKPLRFLSPTRLRQNHSRKRPHRCPSPQGIPPSRSQRRSGPRRHSSPPRHPNPTQIKQGKSRSSTSFAERTLSKYPKSAYKLPTPSLSPSRADHEQEPCRVHYHPTPSCSNVNQWLKPPIPHPPSFYFLKFFPLNIASHCLLRRSCQPISKTWSNAL